MTIAAGDYISFCTNGVFHTSSGGGIPVGERTPILGLSPAAILADYIINTLLKMTLPTDGDDWPLYISHLPGGDDIKTDAGALYDTTGLKDGRLMLGPVITHFGIELTIRSRDYQDGYVKIEDISTLLDGVAYALITIGTDSFELLNASRMGDIGKLGLEQKTTKRRYLFTSNFTLSLRKIV